VEPIATTTAVTFDGHTATISGVRFSHMDHCTRCRNAITAHTDGGTIRAGIRAVTSTHRGRRSQALRWFWVNEPSGRPVAPPVCPNCGVERPNVVNRFTAYGPTPDPEAYDVLRTVWVTIRRDFPDVAAVADQNERGAR